MNLHDIHTHHLRDGAILNESPFDFSPQKGHYYSLGIHPWHSNQNCLREWEALQLLVLHPQVLAIGETGLDKVVQADMDWQKKLFVWQAELAEKINKPLIIHCVKSSNEIIEQKKKQVSSVPWIIHGFRGNKELAAQFIKSGFYLSFGEKYQEEAMKFVPIDRIFIETDQSNVNIMDLYCKACALLNISEKEFTSRINQNLKDVFFNR